MGLFVYEGGAAVEILDPAQLKFQKYTYGPDGVTVLGRQTLDVQAIRVQAGGVWQDAWPRPFANIENYQVLGGGSGFASYRIGANGFAEYRYKSGVTVVSGPIEKWLKAGSASQFVAKAVKDSNPGYAVPTGSPLDQWIDCSSDPEWKLEETGLSSLLTVSIGRVDNNGGGDAITDDADDGLEDSSGNSITDTTISVTVMDTATIYMNTWTD